MNLPFACLLFVPVPIVIFHDDLSAFLVYQLSRHFNSLEEPVYSHHTQGILLRKAEEDVRIERSICTRYYKG